MSSSSVQAVVFDWGHTLMRDFPQYPGPMAFWPEVELMPGAAGALEALRSQYVCCVASNAGDSNAALMGQALERVGIRHYFQHLWTSHELGAAKPSPEFFAAILQRLALAAGACAFVGNDYANDIVPARAIGMKAIWLCQEAEGTLLELNGLRHGMPDAVLRSMEALPATLRRLEATPS